MKTMTMTIKHTYIIPSVKRLSLEGTALMDESGVTGDNGIGYGGVDEQGELDPDANSGVWDTAEETSPASVWD